MADNLEYKCPCCGGALSFDTKTLNMKWKVSSTWMKVW